MEITYEVDDGYVGKSRPLSFEIDDDDLVEFADGGIDTAEQFISDAVQEDFEQRVSWTFRDYDSMIAEAEKLIER